MKQIYKYFLWLFIGYIVVNIGCYLVIRSTYTRKTVNTTIENPQVTISRFNTTVENGYISGSITNNTEEDIFNKFLQLDFYTKHNTLAGTKYVQIDQLLKGESLNFDFNFNYDFVDNLNMKIVDKAEVKETDLLKFTSDNLKLDKVNWWLVFWACVLIWG